MWPFPGVGPDTLAVHAGDRLGFRSSVKIYHFGVCLPLSLMITVTHANGNRLQASTWLVFLTMQVYPHGMVMVNIGSRFVIQRVEAEAARWLNE